MAKEIKRHIQLLKSSGATAPAAADLLYGEIAVGYGKDSEALYIKNSNDDVITFLSSSSSASTIAQAVALAELYADSGDVTSVVGDNVVSGQLSAKASSGCTLTLSHASGSAQSGFKKLSSNAYGHITAGTDVALSDLTALGAVSSARTVSGTGILDGGGNLSADRTITHKTNGSLGSGTAQGSNGSVGFGGDIVIPSVTFDAYGHITGSGSTTVKLPSYITSIEDTSDINLEVTSGKLTATHTNAITAGSAKTSSSEVTATPSGANINIPTIEYDANGHIKTVGSENVSLKVNAAASDTAGVVNIATATGTNNTDTVMTQKAVTDELAAKANSATSVSGAVYDSTEKKIQFKNVGGTVISEIDATDFIKDGMVDNVVISGGNLVITFNEDAGSKEDISIPLTDIFDPSNYYTTGQTSGSSEISTALSAKADTATIITAGTGLTGGGDLSVNRTISLATVGTAGSYYKVETDAYGRVSAGTTTLSTSDISDFSTEMAKKANTATTLGGYGITDAYTKDELTGSSTTVVVAKAASATTAASASNANSAATAAVAESVALANVTNADDLKAIEALEGTSGLLKKTAANTWILDTNTYLTDADAVTSVTLSSGSTNGTLKLTVDGVNGSDVAVPGLGNAAFLNTGTTAGTVAAGDHTHTVYENQDAFSNVKVGDSTIEADSATDTIEFAAAANSGLSITADTTNDKVTFDLGNIECGDYA